MGLRAVNNPKSSFKDPYASTGKEAVTPAPVAVVTTGGDIYKRTESGKNYVYHVFTSPGNFVFSQGAIGAASDSLRILVIGGGGGGAKDDGGGGGAGGVAWCPTYGVLANGTYAVVVGAGGPGGANGSKGGDSTWNAPAPTTGGRITGQGGGGGGKNSTTNTAGGSGGGYGYSQPPGGGPGTQPTQSNPPTTANYGYPGSDRGPWGGGGGGATSAPADRAGHGGYVREFGNFPGPLFSSPYSPTGSAMPADWQSAVAPQGYFAGGGGGGGRNGPGSFKGGGRHPWNSPTTVGPLGGSGNGQGSPNSPVMTAGLAGTGSGGGGQGAGQGTPGASGGSGIVIVRYLDEA